MSNSYKGIVVTFEEPLSEEAAGKMADCIRALRWVGNVTPVVAASVNTMDDHMNRDMVRMQLVKELFDTLVARKK